MSVLIRMGDAVKQALDKTVNNMKQRASGLFVPADYIAGKHFGGFSGYEPWIQDCIRAACRDARGIGPDELSEITSVVAWLGPATEEHPPQTSVMYFRHREAIEKLKKFTEAVGEKCGTKQSLSREAETQISRVQGSRELGTLVIVALNYAEVPELGKLMMSVSAWNPASVEEAKAIPRQKYQLG